MRSLRILLLNSARRWIGEAAHTFTLARALESRGHWVLLGVRRGFELEKRAAAEGLRYRAFTLNSRFIPWDDLRDTRAIRQILRDEKIDLIQVNRGKDHWLAAAAQLFAARPPVPLIRARHVVTPAKDHWVNRWLYSRATDAVLSVSQAARSSLGPLAALAAHGDPRRDRVLYSAVDADLFSPNRRSEATRNQLGAAPGDVVIGLVGRIQRIKGQRPFLEAAARVARLHPHTRFVLAGRGTPEQTQALREYAENAGLPRENLILLGVVDNLPDIMAAFDIGVVASLGSEGHSRVTLEYMASALPVVATRVGGIPELLTDGNEGFLIEHGNPEMLAQRLETLVADAELRRHMGETGRQTTTTRFHPTRWIGEVEDFYDTVLHCVSSTH